MIRAARMAWTQGRHPHISAAQKSLAAAEREILESAHHYGGHRAKALELTRQARVELKDALQWAREHPKGPGPEAPPPEKTIPVKGFDVRVTDAGRFIVTSGWESDTHHH